MKKRKIILISIIVICSISIIISGYFIIRWIIDSKNTQDQIDDASEKANLNEVVDNNNTVIIEQEEEIPEENPYWDYIKMNLIDVDFKDLKKENNQTKGWIQVGGTNINYPFVQSKDNEFYLKHSFDKSYNTAGWVFMDYRNNAEDYDKNTILYGHGRKDKTVFGTLRNILKNGWLKNTDNYIVKLSTEKENTLWQVFSVYHIPTTIDYLKTTFINDEEFEDFGKMLLKRSAHDFNTNINENDKILTLSTCYNDTDKVVLHAKLIKKEER